MQLAPLFRVFLLKKLFNKNKTAISFYLQSRRWSFNFPKHFVSDKDHDADRQSAKSYDDSDGAKKLTVKV
jgi:hypothetical protein